MACHETSDPAPRRRPNWAAILTYGGLLAFWVVVLVVAL